MLQTGININSQSNVPYVSITLDYCAFSTWTLIVRFIQAGIIYNTGLRCLSFLHLVMFMSLLDVLGLCIVYL